MYQVAVVVKNHPVNAGHIKRREFDPWLREDPLEKEMTTYSNILAWRIPWTDEPGGLQSIRSQRVRHN